MKGVGLPGRGELTDGAWAVIEPLLLTNGNRGQQWSDHCRAAAGILWRLRTGAPWRNVPKRYGPWQTCYDGTSGGGAMERGRGFQRTCRPGSTWQGGLRGKCQRHGDAGAPAHGGGEAQVGKSRPIGRISHLEDEGLGGSWGGPTTKVPLACGGQGRLLLVVVAPGRCTKARNGSPC